MKKGQPNLTLDIDKIYFYTTLKRQYKNQEQQITLLYSESNDKAAMT